MNKRYKKMLATGLALNMTLINIPYNVFANSDMIENIILNENNVSLIGEEIESDLDNFINQDEQISNNEDLIIEESDSGYTDKETASELLEAIIEEDNSNIVENNINENILTSVTGFAENIKIAKSSIPNVINYADSFAGGDGSQESPYQISNALELARLAYLVNEENLDTTNMYFELTSDIDLEGFDADNNGSNGNWISVGHAYWDNGTENIVSSFKGVFNGNNYAISNMQIEDTQSYAGLFGVTSNAYIKNIEMIDTKISNVYWAGSLVGLNDSLGNLNIENIKVNGFSYFLDSNADGSASWNTVNVGSLVGYHHGGYNNADNSIKVKNIQVDDSSINIDNNSIVAVYAGGLVGNIFNVKKVEITDCIIDVNFKAKNAGGACGNISANNSNKVNINNIDVNMRMQDSSNSFYYGGICAELYAYLEEYTDVVVENCNIAIDSNLTSSVRLGGVFAHIGGSGNDTHSIKCKGINVEFLKKGVSNTAGGIIGQSMLSSPLISVEDCSVKGDFAVKYYGGGAVGDVQNLYCNTFTYIGEIEGISGNYSYIGGVLGGQYSPKVDISNTNIDISIYGDAGYGGGIVGYLSAYNGASITNCNVSANIEGIFTSGGIVGYHNSGDLTIDDIVVGSENLKSTFSGVLNFNNAKFDNYGIGGIIGCSKYINNITLKNSKVFANIADLDSDSIISSIGGLIGSYVSGNKNINLNILNVEFNGDIKGYNVGGAIGSINSDSSTVTVDNFINNGNIISTTTISDGATGGVIGCVEKGSVTIRNSGINSNISTFGSRIGGLIGYVSIENNYFVNIEKNGININIESNSNNALNVGGIIGKIDNNGSLSINNNFAIGDIDTVSNNKGYFSSIIDNNGEIVVSNTYFVSNIDTKNSINDRDTYLYSELNGNEIEWNNIYYNSDISSLSDAIATPLTTEQMQGYPTFDNMDFDFNDVWKANKEYYPTFKQLNTAPELYGEDIELILNQKYNLLDYVTVEDFEDKDLIPEITTNLDITKIGNYTATFTVVDPGGLTDDLTLNIKVVAERPVINANDLTLYIGDKFNPLDKVTAIDINGNDITEHIKVIENTVDTSKKGIYKVVYQVNSLERLSTTKEIKVTVLEKDVSNNNNKVENDSNESHTTDKPQTGDNFTVYGISLLASLIGLLYLNIKSKKED